MKALTEASLSSKLPVTRMQMARFLLVVLSAIILAQLTDVSPRGNLRAGRPG
jgi:hypothetical protein